MNKRLFISLLLVCWLGVSFSQTGNDNDIYGARSGSLSSKTANNPSRSEGQYGLSQKAGWISLLQEGFDDISTLPGSGWVLINNSDPIGSSIWFQGNTGVFSAHDPNNTDAYIAANFNNVNGPGTISNWLLTPMLSIQDGNELRFWTRTTSGSNLPDRLELRMSLSGSSSDVGSTAVSVGDFTEVLMEINPGLAVGGYPGSWTQYTIVVSGVPVPLNGRFAFRYFVEDGGPSGSNGNYIGIDTVEYLEPTFMVPLNNWAVLVSLCLMVVFSLLFFKRVLF